MTFTRLKEYNVKGYCIRQKSSKLLDKDGDKMIPELEKQLKMSYKDQCLYLQEKYGLPIHDYFATPECKTKSKKISRTSEGLFCHHNAEGITSNGGNLGEPHMARMNPYEYQKKENLCYCNYLEHLILHLKINAMSRSQFEWPHQIKRFFNSLGFYWICQDINTLYAENGSEQKWRNDCYQVIKNNFADYVDILRSAFCFVEMNYTNEKQIPITEGSKLVFEYMLPTGNANLGDKLNLQYQLCPATVVRCDNSSEGKSIVRFERDNSEMEIQTMSLRRKFDFRANVLNGMQSVCGLCDGTDWDVLVKELRDSSYMTEQAIRIATWLKEGIGDGFQEGDLK